MKYDVNNCTYVTVEFAIAVMIVVAANKKIWGHVYGTRKYVDITCYL